MNELANRFGFQPNLLWAVAAMLASLLVGSLLRVVWLLVSPMRKMRDRLDSLKTWWALVLLFCAAVLLGRVAVAALFAAASGLAMWEFLRLSARNGARNSHAYWMCAIVPLHFAWVVIGDFELFWMTIPVASLLVISAASAASASGPGFLRDATTGCWALLLIVFSLSHAAMLLALPDASNPIAGSAGWLVYLVLLTEVNDISQALWGRRLGRRKVTPYVSPNKTWEGLLLGIGTTIIISMMLAPLLTPLTDGPRGISRSLEFPLSLLWPALVGGLLAVSGFFGDITISAVKRDVGVKDSGTILPGQGGMLDRIDSLTFTAPIMFYIVYWFYVDRA